MENKMVSFHGDKKLKAKYVSRVRAHQDADNLIRGQGWKNGKGCAIGCTLENYDHSQYPVELGIPEWLARVEDALFEGMSKDKSDTWPEKFLLATPIGVDLEQVRSKFSCAVLEHSIVSLDSCVYDKKEWPQVAAAVKQSKAAVSQMIKAQKSGKEKDLRSAESAARSAESAANASWSAAESATNAANASWSAAWSAANAARNAARNAAWSAAESAANAAESAAESAANAAWSAVYDYYADSLLKILKSCK